MLVMFKFKNYGPFKEETVFDMRAINSYKEHPYNLISECDNCSLLKVAAIYGANASGKSSFVSAYDSFLSIVQDSFRKNDKEENESILERNYFPFIFEEESFDSDIEFDSVYYDNSTEYRYGFIYNSDEIKYEWLYKKSLNTNRQSMIFERTHDKINLGSSVKKSCEKYINDIDVDVLALSFFSSLKLRTSVFKDVLTCIAAILPTTFRCDEQSNYLLKRYFDKDFNEKEKPTLLAFLNAIDVGIKDIEVEKSQNHIMVYTYHRGRDGKLYRIPIELESDGTRQAIVIYSFIRIAVLYGKGLIIDEFNNQLHPLLQKYLIDLFYEDSAHGQLIYITHDTSLMDKRYMRRDQIWFTEKDSAGVSSLYSLAEYKIRNDASFEKDYLGGIYGGIPKLKDFSFKEE